MVTCVCSCSIRWQEGSIINCTLLRACIFPIPTIVKTVPLCRVQYAGVLYAKGNVTITGGLFSNNEGDLRGGVFDAAIGSSIVITGGVFEGNIGGDHGGVGFVASGSTLLIEGGNFSGNVAEVGGGAFYVEEETDFSVRRGVARRAELVTLGVKGVRRRRTVQSYLT